MFPEANDPIEDRQPKFQTFVTWVFYAAIVLLGYGILGKFDSLSLDISSIRSEMANMNVRLVQIFERQGFNDKEIEALRSEVRELQRKKLK